MVYGKTRTDVRDKMKRVRERLDAGTAVKDSKRTLADWLAHWRGTTLVASDRKESTRELYANLCRRHLEPKPFGAIRLDKLKPSDIEALVLAMRAKTKPGKRTDKNLNPEPVRALPMRRSGRPTQFCGPVSTVRCATGCWPRTRLPP